MSGSPVGLTKDAGWEAGKSKTLPLTPEQAWDLLLSPAGLAAWLGDDLAALPHEKGARYETAHGTTGEVRSFRPVERMRVTWQPPGRDAPATLQVALRPGPRGTAIGFHAERLSGPEEREALIARWGEALARLAPD